MKATKNMWAVVDPTGKIMSRSVTETKKETVYNAFTWGRCGDDRKAKDFLKEGYRVIRVRVEELL